MRIADFEAHPLWETTALVAEQLSELHRTEPGPSLDAIAEMQVRLSYVQGVYATRKRLAELMLTEMLNEVNSQLAYAHNSMTEAQLAPESVRLQVLTQALAYMQGSTRMVAAWPNPRPTSAQESQEFGMLEYLAEIQTRSAEALIGRSRDLTLRLDEIMESIAEARERNQALSKEFDKKAAAVVLSVDEQKVRVDSVISEGNATISKLEGENQAAFDAWRKRAGNELRQANAALLKDMGELQEEVNANHLALSEKIDDYETLVQADSADRLAKHYESEARALEKSGWNSYRLGYSLLGVASLPLLGSIVLPFLEAWFEKPVVAPSWETIVIRVAFAAVIAAIAAVSIRLGSRLLSQANEYKRLAMELRTMGPFLSNVSDKELVDSARLELVDRTFGRAYGVVAKEDPQDAVPVGVLQEMFSMIAKISK